jgi:hypothetical protein
LLRFLGEEVKSTELAILKSLEGEEEEDFTCDNVVWDFNICCFTEVSTQRSLQRSSDGIEREFWMLGWYNIKVVLGEVSTISSSNCLSSSEEELSTRFRRGEVRPMIFSKTIVWLFSLLLFGSMTFHPVFTWSDATAAAAAAVGGGGGGSVIVDPIPVEEVEIVIACLERIVLNLPLGWRE